MKLFLVILVVVLVLLGISVLYLIFNVSDFGESDMYLTVEEYEETCKGYNDYWKERNLEKKSKTGRKESNNE